MGDAKRRKALDPNYGKPNQTTLAIARMSNGFARWVDSDSLFNVFLPDDAPGAGGGNCLHRVYLLRLVMPDAVAMAGTVCFFEDALTPPGYDTCYNWHAWLVRPEEGEIIDSYARLKRAGSLVDPPLSVPSLEGAKVALATEHLAHRGKARTKWLEEFFRRREKFKDADVVYLPAIGSERPQQILPADIKQAMRWTAADLFFDARRLVEPPCD